MPSAPFQYCANHHFRRTIHTTPVVNGVVEIFTTILKAENVNLLTQLLLA